MGSIINKPRTSSDDDDDTSEDRYCAGMLLGGVGDALGFKNGDWEFCYSGMEIHGELARLEGINAINVEDWKLSDDTIMHLATADALVASKGSSDLENVYQYVADYCKKCMKDMKGRSPGATCIEMCKKLDLTKPKGYRIPFNPRGGGCGAPMRSMCIGLRYPRPRDIEDLIEVSIEAGRMTHHHPTGYLGSLASALFASYAVQKKAIKRMGRWSYGNSEVHRFMHRCLCSRKRRGMGLL